MRRLRRSGKVLVLAPAGGIRGGIDSVVSRHASSCMWRDNNCELIRTYANDDPLAKVWAALRAFVLAAIKTPSARLVHVHLAGETSLLRKLPFIAMAKLFRRPVIVHVHAASPESLFHKTPVWATRLAMLAPNRVIALSQRWADSIHRHYPAANVVVIPNPAVIPPVRSNADLRGPVVVFVGKLEQRKGYSDLIHAAKEVLRSVPEARFQLAGDGQVEDARRLARSLGISHAVECLGWVGRDELPDLLNKAAVFCLPSYNEGVPMAMLEAMSYGVPVVTTPVGGIPDVIQSQANGILFNPGDLKTLAREITCLLENKKGLRSTLGEAGRSTVEALCGLGTIGHLLSTLYDEIAPAHDSRNGRREYSARTHAPASISKTPKGALP